VAATTLDRKRQLRLLDHCLQQVEDAQERGESVLSEDLAARVGEIVGPLPSGMSITDAMEMIFSEQERYLAGSDDPAPTGVAGRPGAQAGRGDEVPRRSLARHQGRQPDREGPGSGETLTAPLPAGAHLARGDREPMSEAEARLLTERIRTATRYVCLLLREVHQRRAWVSLGYANWEQYVQTEFSISRSRSYELLDQANVILDLRSAAGMNELPDVSAYVAVQIKGRLPLIIETLRQRISEAKGRAPRDIVTELVEEHRRQIAQSRRLVQARRGRRQHGEEPGDQGYLSEAIEVLAHMAETGRVQEAVEAAAEPLPIEIVESAIQWLNDLLAELKRKHRLSLRAAPPTRAGPRDHAQLLRG
jgi:hypothetical protein